MKRFITFGIVCILSILASPIVSAAPCRYADQIYSQAANGDQAGLKNTKNRGIDLDTVGCDGNTAICKAVLNRDYYAFRILDLAGADTSPSCLKAIPAARLAQFEKVYASYYGSNFNWSAGFGWKTGAVLGVGAVAGVALAAGGGGGGGGGSSKDCSKTPCAKGCYKDLTCQIGSVCAEYNKCGGCERCIEQNIPHCSVYKPHENKCKICENMFYPNDSGKCVSITVDNCQKSDGVNNACSVCETEYNLNAGNCYNDQDYCTDVLDMGTPICDPAQVKSYCTLQRGGTDEDYWNCIDDEVTHCRSKDPSTGECLKCASKYYLENGVCHEIPNCAASNGTDNACTVCEANYNLNAGQCFSDEDYCKDVLHLDAPVCAATQDKAYCVLARGGTNTNFWTCTGDEDANCLIKDNTTGECSQCNSGYYPNHKGICVLIAASHCETSDGVHNTCDTCASGYYPNGADCEKISHCTNSDGTENKCNVCDGGYYLDTDSQCYNEQNYCARKGYVVNHACETWQTADFCPLPDSSSSSLYRRCDNNEIEHCRVTNDNGSCKTCDSLYHPSSSGSSCELINFYDTCQASDGVNNACITCYFGSHPDAAGKCQAIDNCVISNGQDDVCTKCASGYYPNNGVCESIANCEESEGNANVCVTCVDNYYLHTDHQCYNEADYCSLIGYNVSESCKSWQNSVACPLPNGSESSNYHKCLNTTISHCMVAKEDGSCQQCENLYHPTDNGASCTKIPDPKCESSSGTSASCTKCANGYYPDNGECEEITAVHCVESNGESNACTTCASGYYPNGTACTVIPNCAVSDGQSANCTTCASNTNLSGGVCYSDNDYCETVLGLGTPVCAATQEKSYCTLQRGGTNTGYWACTGSEDGNCETKDTLTGKCTKCENGYYPDTKGVCVAISAEHCVESSGTGNTCDTCAGGYYPEGSGCTAIAHCTTSDGQSTTCTGCADGYYLNGGVCYNEQDYCQLTGYDQASSCEAWQDTSFCELPGGATSTTYRTCVNKEIEHCRILNDNGSCKQCDNLYYLESGASCQAIDSANCTTSDGINNACGTCNSGYYTNEGTCKVISNCAVSNGKDNSCTKCESGYYPNNGVCTQIANCALSNGITNTCTSCVDGYYLLPDGQCRNEQDYCANKGYSKVDDCEVWQNATYCPLPGGGTSTTYHNCTNNAIEYCLENNDNGSCRKCESLYYPTNDGALCSKISATNCVSSEGTDNVCTQCISSYYPEGSTCAKIANCTVSSGLDDNCTQCNSTYYPNDGVCTQIPNCAVSNGSTNVCTTCSVNYNLNDGTCYNDADYCTTVQHLGTPVCAATQEKNYCELARGATSMLYWGCSGEEDTNCAIKDETTGRCSRCYSGYYPDNRGVCVEITAENCEQSSGMTNTCSTCVSGYYPEGTGCTAISHCASSDGTSSTCTGCESGYYLNGGVCYNEQDYCQLTGYEQASACEAWQETSFCELPGGATSSIYRQCINKEIEHCRILNDNGSCKVCESLYYPTDGGARCSQIEAYSTCQASDGMSNNCTTCQFGYYPTGSECSAIPNCVVSNGKDNICTQCQSTYYPNNGVCEQIENCAQSGGIVNACTNCVDNYNLHEGVCYNDEDYCKNILSMDKPVCDATQTKVYCPLQRGGEYTEYWTCDGDPDPNCFIKDTSTGMCQQCNSGYYPDLRGICVQIDAEHCQKSDGVSNACTVCENSYYLDNTGNCIEQNIEHCSIYAVNQNKCDTCDNLYYPTNSSTVCSPISAYNTCQQSDGKQNACSWCYSTYYPNNGICSSIPNCAVSDGYENRCQTCSTDYYLYTDDQCYTEQAYCAYTGYVTVEPCKAWQETNYCPLPGGESSSTYHTCQNKEIDHCAAYNEDGSCKRCDNLYYVTNGGATCSPLTTDNCETSDGIEDKCTHCDSAYYIDGNVCSAIANCAQSDGYDNVCTRCNSAYYLDNGQCAIIPYCAESGGYENKCTKCTYNHYLYTDDQCYDEQNYCSKTGYTVVEPCKDWQNTDFCLLPDASTSQTYRICQNKEIEHCVENNADGSCKQCESMFYVTNGGATCSPITQSNCQSSAGIYDACTRCDSTYYLNNGTCSAIANCAESEGYENVCTQCHSAYYPNNGVCTFIPNCSVSGGYENQCQTCMTNYYVGTDGQCYNEQNYCTEMGYDKTSCEPWQSATFCPLPNSSISSTYRQCANETIEHCSVYNEDGSCKTCDNLYYLENSATCKEIDSDHCTTSDGEHNTCSRCQSTYYLNNGTCTAIANCTESEGYENVCTQCQSTYYPNGSGICTIIPNCSVSGGQENKCQICSSNYYLYTDNQCYNEQNYCSKTGYNKTACEVWQTQVFCPLPDASSSSTYRQCVNETIDHCSVYNEDGSCNQCENLFYLTNGGATCSQITAQNCMSSDGKVDICGQCDSSYYPNGKQCTQINNCQASDGEYNVCTQCHSTYYPNNGICTAIANCAESAGYENECQVCSTNYYLYTDNQCYNEQNYCSKTGYNKTACAAWQTPTFCPLPDTSSSSTYRTCTNKTIDHCSVYNEDGSCKTCDNLYYPTDGGATCSPITDVHCQTNDGEHNTCNRCQSTYYLNNGICSAIANCAESEGYDNECQVCSTNYYLYTDNQCYNEQNYCSKTGYDKTACAAWQTPTFCPLPDASSSSTYRICTNETINHCSVYNEDGSCKTCDNLYYPTDGGATCSPITDGHCQTSDGEHDVCNRCQSTYYLNNGTCSAIANCAESAGYENVCQVCSTNYYLYTDNQCYNEQNYCSKTGYDKTACAAWQTQIFCPLPDAPISSTYRQCANEIIEHCAVYNEDGSCMTCDSLFYPTDGGATCSPITDVHCQSSDGEDNTCSRCQSTYYPNNGVCTAIANCAESAGYENVCQVCSTNYYLYTDNQCYNEQNYCLKTGYNKTSCSAWQTPTFCPLPDAPISSTYRSCTNETIDHCSIYNEDGSCKTCDNLFYLTDDGATCSPITSGNCGTSDGKNNACTTCNTGFYPDSDGICTTQNIGNCLVYVDNQNKCDTCNSKYYLTNDGATCSPITSFDNCQGSGGKVDQCGQCQSGYYINGSQCSKIANCIASGGYENICTQCNSTYYPNSDGACTVIPNCSVSGGYENKCQTCSSNYYLYTDNQCYNEQNYCSKTGYDKTSCLAWQTPSFCLLPGEGSSSTYRSCSNGTIGHCSIYNEDGSCKTCDNLFYLENDGATCSPITSGNCGTSDGKNNACTVCNTGFYPDGDGICTQQNIGNCSVYVDNQNKCDTCNSKYYPASDGATCSPITSFDNCQGSNGKIDQCGQCSSRYYINGNQCTLIADCQSSDGYDNVCTRCNSTYYPDSDGTCTAIPNCSVSGGYENKCQTCSSNYYLYTDNQCYNEQSYCSKTGYDKTTCLAWQTPTFCSLPGAGSSSTYRQCTNETIDHCSIYNADGSCKTCDNLFYLENGGATCSPITSGNCGTSDGKNNACTTCNTGFYPNASGICTQQNIGNCSVYVDNQNKCDTCNSKYYLTSDGATCSPITSFDNCQGSGGKVDQCGQCQSGYYINGNQCTKIANCQSSDGYDNVCTRCNSTYYPNGSGVCTIIPNCSVSGGYENKCQTCSSNYYLYTDNQCYNEQSYCSKTGYDKTSCSAWQTPTFCPLPGDGSSSTYRTCTGDEVEHCTAYENGKCVTCESLFYPTDGGATCSPITQSNCQASDGEHNTCSRCDSSYYVNGGTCIRISNCAASEGYNNVCTQCNSTYYPNGSGVCTKISNCQASNGYDNECSRCNSAYYIDGGACTAIPNCSASGGYYNQCTTCSTNYNLNNGVCYSDNDYCTDVLGLGTPTCDATQETVYCPLQRGGTNYSYWSCEGEADPNCAIKDTSTGKCSTCNNLYYPDGNGICQPITSGSCTTSDGVNNACTTCASGFYPNASGICTQQYIGNCSIYVENQNKCDTCNSKYYPTDGGATCSPITSFDTCQYSGGKDDLCSQCQATYYPKGSQCTKISNCQASNGYDNVCSRCDSAYYINGGACMAIPNCSASGGYYNQCTTCSTNYNLNNGVCYSDNDYCTDVLGLGTPTCYATQDKVYCPLARGGTNYSYWSCEGEADPNCATRDASTGKCSTCNNLYYPDGNGICQPITSGSCTTSDGVNNACTTCNTGFYPNASGICTQQNIGNCSVYVDNQNKCDTCNSKYYPTSDGAVCSQISAYSTCYRSNGKDNACTQCNSSYYVNGSQCTKISNCQTSAGYVNNCTRCNSTYYVNDSYTCSQVPNCNASQGYDNICTSCKSTHPQLGSNGVCYTEYDYCTSYLATNYTNTTGCLTSSQYPEFCPLATGGSSTTYRTCKTGTVSYCTRYSQNASYPNTCELCQGGYYLSGNACINQTPIFGCKTYLTHAAGCQECHEGFDLYNASCSRNSTYVAGGDYVYRVSNYDSNITTSGTTTLTTPVVVTAATSGVGDIYSNSTIIGFTSIPMTASDYHHSSNTQFGTEYFGEYDVFNTSYSDNSGTNNAYIILDGSNVIGASGGVINEAASNAGYLIGLSSPYNVDNRLSYGGSWVGHANVYNAASWQSTEHSMNGYIQIVYDTPDGGGQFNVYGIYGKNRAYNAYTNNPNPIYYSTGEANGYITLYIDNDVTNYGIYAGDIAFNAYGPSANGDIHIVMADSGTGIGVHGYNMAVNAAAGGKGSIVIEGWGYGVSSQQYAYNAYNETNSDIYSDTRGDITVWQGFGVHSPSNSAYNAYNKSTGYISLVGSGTAVYGKNAYNAYNGATGHIEGNGNGLQATQNAYNVYQGGNGEIMITAGTALQGQYVYNVMDGGTGLLKVTSGTAMRASVAAYNAFGYTEGYPANGTITLTDLRGEPATLCAGGGQCINAAGQYATGTINLSGRTLLNFINSVDSGNGILNVHDNISATVTQDPVSRTILDSTSQNGENGHINVYLGQGWDNRDKAISVTAIDGSDLEYKSTIVITRDYDFDTYVGEIVGVNNGKMTGNSSYTPSITIQNVTADNIYGIKNAKGSILGDISILDVSIGGDDEAGNAYGAYYVPDSFHHEVSRANIGMNVTGNDNDSKIYGLANARNDGSIDISAAGELEYIYGMYDDSYCWVASNNGWIDIELVGESYTQRATTATGMYLNYSVRSLVGNEGYINVQSSRDNSRLYGIYDGFESYMIQNNGSIYINTYADNNDGLYGIYGGNNIENNGTIDIGVSTHGSDQFYSSISAIYNQSDGNVVNTENGYIYVIMGRGFDNLHRPSTYVSGIYKSGKGNIINQGSINITSRGVSSVSGIQYHASRSSGGSIENSGSINLTDESALDVVEMYGIYAYGDNMNISNANGTISLTNSISGSDAAYGIFAGAYSLASSIVNNGSIDMLVGHSVIYGIYNSLGDAANVTEGAYTGDITIETDIYNKHTVYGIYAKEGNAYNVNGDSVDGGGIGNIIINVGNVDSPVVAIAAPNGTAYNASYGSGTITLVYGGGIALSGQTAINAEGNYEHPGYGTINIGSASHSHLSETFYEGTFINARGSSEGIINIYGTVAPLTNFTNSGDSTGLGTINIYAVVAPSTLDRMTVLGSGSENGPEGHINIELGSGWRNGQYSVTAIDGSDLGEFGSVNIRRMTDEKNVYLNEIIGVQNGAGGGDFASITIGGNTYSGRFLRANNVWAIKNLTASIIESMNISIGVGLPYNDMDGTVYGITHVKKGTETYSTLPLSSNAQIDIDVHGGASSSDNTNSAYGLYNVDNGSSGFVTMDSYSDIDAMYGIYNDSYSAIHNYGTITMTTTDGNNKPTFYGMYLDSGIGFEAINSGTVSLNGADVAYGILADSYSLGTVSNSGTIEGNNIREFTGISVYSNWQYGTVVTNSGTVSASVAAGTYNQPINVTGIDLHDSYYQLNATNSSIGKINITVDGYDASSAGRVIGMKSSLFGTITNYGEINLTTTSRGRVEYMIGMYAQSMATAVNRGTINIIDNGGQSKTIGMLATQAATIENYGTINITTNGALGVGMEAVDGATLKNYGTIRIDGGTFTQTVVNGTNGAGPDTFYTYYDSSRSEPMASIITDEIEADDNDETDEPQTETPLLRTSSLMMSRGARIITPVVAEDDVVVDNNTEDENIRIIAVDETSTIENNGTIESQTALHIAGGGKMLMSRGSNIISPSVSGTLTLGADIAAEGNEDTYVTTNLVTGNTDGLSVASESVMFTATTVVNDEDDNSVDGVLTRKPFETMVKSLTLANYLETNYKGNNAQDFFTTLKTASNAAEFDEIVSKELGLCLIPNFAQENFNAFRSLGNLITDNLFSKEMTSERMMVGYDHLALSRDDKKNITGYENNSNSSYFIGDIELDKRSRFGLGMSITKFSSSYDDDSDRKETFAQLLASYMYDFGGNWRYAGVLHSGYGWGEYTRKLNQGDVDGNLHDFVYGLQNEVRYGFVTPYAVIEPQFEMNLTGYYQRRITEDKNKAHSIMMKGANNFSAESGIGLYASKEFNLEKYGKFKGRVGGSYYHEWAHPYATIKAQMRGTDGWYKIESDDIFERDRFMISADVTYTYKMLDLYLRGSQYFEKDSVAVFNAGLKYNF